MNENHSSAAPSLRAPSAIAAIATIGLALGCVISSANSQTAKPAQFAPRDEDPKDFTAGAGRDDTFYGCTACHGFRLVAQQGISRDRWDETRTYMTIRHKMPDIQGKDRDVILTYLAANYGPKIGKSTPDWKNPLTLQ